MNKNILVTGAAGFMGSFLCEELISKGYWVLGIDNFFRGKEENLANLKSNPNFVLENLDLSLETNVSSIKKMIEKHNIHTVFHLAAVNGTQYFYDRPLFVLDQNVKITQNLLAGMVNTNVNYIIYTSSSEVYGDPLRLPTNEEHPILLNAKADRDSYAASKALGDFYLRLFAKQHNLQYLILRVFNMYGERMVGTRYGQVIPEFINRMLFEKTFTILGDGSHTRSFCYIRDAVFIIRELMEKQVTGIVNVGNNQEITILELAKLLHHLEKRNFEPSFLAERPNDHKRRCPDIRHLKSIFPELKLTSLEAGLRHAIDFYKNGAAS